MYIYIGIVSEESKELYAHWDAFSLFNVIVSNQIFWVNVSAILKKQEFPYVVLKILHVLASYKELEVLEIMWIQLQKYSIIQVCICLYCHSLITVLILQLF
jgi:hypothetical protein